MHDAGPFERIASDPYARSLGIELIELSPGFARVSMVVREDMLNFRGIPHGGAIFSLADAAFAAASNSHDRAGVALNVGINFLAAPEVGTTLYATGREERLGGRTALYALRVESADGTLVALAQGLVYRK